MKFWDSFEFSIIADNEKESQNMLQLTRPKEGEQMQLGLLGQYYKFNGCQILYISDLHLDNILAESKCKSKEGVNTVLRRVGQKLDNSYKEYANFLADGNVVVILDGDITHSPYLFEQFTINHSDYQRVSTEVGESFDLNSHTRTSDSSPVGRVKRVIIKGYKNTSGTKKAKSFVEIR